MNDLFEKSNPTTCGDSSGATSSPALEAGKPLCNSPTGQPTKKSGHAVVRASLTAMLAKAKETTTNAISGRISSGSPESVALTSSLENRLRPRFDSVGSMEYRQIWKQKVTPSGRSYWEHTARAPRIKDNDFIGWRTPSAGDGERGLPLKDHPRQRHTLATQVPLTPWSPDSNERGGAYQDPEKVMERMEAGHQVNLEDQATLSAWPSPAAVNWRDGRSNQHGKNSRPLQEVAALAGWQTPHAPRAHDSDNSRSTYLDRQLSGGVSPTAQDSVMGTNPPRPHDTGIALGQMAAWATPRAEDSEQTGAHHGKADMLNSQSKLASAPWPTPQATQGPNMGKNRGNNQYRNRKTAQSVEGLFGALNSQSKLTPWGTPHVTTNGGNGNPKRNSDGMARIEDQAFGVLLPLSKCETEKAAVSQGLNAYFSQWLMGFPTAWTAAGRKAASLFARKSKGARCS